MEDLNKLLKNYKSPIEELFADFKTLDVAYEHLIEDYNDIAEKDY